jgi:hypothetical protein
VPPRTQQSMADLFGGKGRQANGEDIDLKIEEAMLNRMNMIMLTNLFPAVGSAPPVENIPPLGSRN